MNDRFMFRTWDNIYKKYRNGLAFQDNRVCTYDDNVCVLEQCTGLKDKNGKLIYEGDIVEYKISTGIKQRGVVEYSNVSGNYHKGGQALGTYQKSTVIIGNIHKNPEMLGGTK